MEILNKSTKVIKELFTPPTIKDFKVVGHAYVRIFRGCILSCNMVGIGKSKYLTYPRKVYFIKLSLAHPNRNLRLMKRNFLENTRFIIKTIK